MTLRTNNSMALTIVEGLKVDSLLGSKTAWAYLAANEVPTPTILRVLISQARRRATDPIYAVDSGGTIIWHWLPPQAPASAVLSQHNFRHRESSHRLPKSSHPTK